LVYIKAMSNGALPKKSKPESIAEDILKKYGYKYVGDGSLWISGKNPDFVNTDKMSIIEIFSVYHDNNIFDVPWHRTENGTKEIYNRNGYVCHIVWAPKNNCKKNIDYFISNIMEVIRACH